MQPQDSFVCRSSLKLALDRCPIRVTPGTLLTDVVSLMDGGSGRHSTGLENSSLPSDYVLVMDGATLIGIFTERDVIRLISGGWIPDGWLTVAEVMTQPVITLTLSDETDIFTALSCLRQHQIRHLPIVDSQGQLLGVVTPSTLLAAEQPATTSWIGQQEFLRSVIDTDPNLIFVKDWNGRFVFVNQAVAEVYETTVAALIGHKDGDFNLNSAEFHQYLRDDRQVMTTLQPKVIPEETISSPSGKVRWLQTIKKPLLSPEGQCYILGVSTDITERKLVEAAQEESEERFRYMANAAPVLMWMSGTDGLCTFFNQTWLNFTGRSLAAELGNGWRQGIHPEDASRCLERYLSAFNARDRFQLEYRLRRADGEYCWILDKGVPRFTPDGEFAGYIGSCLDLTEHKQAEAALQQTNEQLQAVLDAVPGFVSWMSADGRYLGVNKQLAESFNLPTDAFVGQELGFLKSNPKFSELMHQFLASPEMATSQVLDTYINGSVRNYLLVNQKYNQGASALSVGIDITERKQAEAALLQSEERFRAIFEQAAVGIAEVTLDGQWLRVNQKLCEIIGYSREELLELNFQSLTDPDDLETDLEYIRQILADEIKTYSMEKRYICKDGSLLWVNLTVSLVHESTGEPKYFIKVIQDISDRKQAEAALQASEAKFRHIYENSPVMMHSIDETGKLCNVNGKWLEETGYTREEVLGQSANFLMTAESAQRAFSTVIPQFWREGYVRNIPYEYVRKDGTVIDILLNCEATIEPSGRRVSLSVARNVTEQKRAELALRQLNEQLEFRVQERTRELEATIVVLEAEIAQRQLAEAALRESQERLQTILDNSPAVIYLMDADNRFLLANRKYENLFHISQDQIVGKSIFEVWPPEIADPFAANNQKVLTTGKPIDVEEMAPHKDGLHTYYSIKFPLRDANGTPYAVCGISTDITERKQAEATLQHTKDQLQAVLDAVPGFVAWVDADLRYEGVNRYLAHTFNLTPDAFVGQELAFHKHNPEFAEFMSQVLDGNEQSANQVIEVQVDDSIRNYLMVAQKYQKGRAAVLVGIDISDRQRVEEQLKTSLQEKEVLLKEIHHRVKNNLQIISSLLKLQTGYINDEKALSLFTDSYNRVRSMALIHENLYQSLDLAKIELANYIKTLVANLSQSYRISSTYVKFQVEVAEIALDIDTAIPCGLIINELVSNSLKYAFTGEAFGEIKIHFFQDERGFFQLKVSDTGIGLNPNFDIRQAKSLGLKLVFNLTRQLGGDLKFYNQNGTVIEIKFPCKTRLKK